MNFEKFSLNDAQLDALEAAIQYMMLDDIHHAFVGRRALRRTAQARLNALHKRRGRRHSRAGKDSTMAFGFRVPAGGPLTSFVDDRLKKLGAKIDQGLAGATALQRMIMLIELISVEPYAVEGESKLEVASASRSRAIARFEAGRIHAAQAEPLDEACANGLEEAARVYRTSVLGALTKAAAFLIATVFGPVFVAGLVGTWAVGLVGVASGAGVAVLGGGALVTGGFGVVGCTVIVAAGAGLGDTTLSSIFLGKKGASAAEMAIVKTLALFRALIATRLLDAELANNLKDAIARQQAQYESIAGRASRASNGLRALQAREVASVFATGRQKLADWHRRAIAEDMIAERPKAWASTTSKPRQIEDADFAELAESIASRNTLLSDALRWLADGHVAYKDASSRPFVTRLFAQLSPKARKRLQRGDGALELVRSDILELAHQAERDVATFARIAQKAARMVEEHKALDGELRRAQALSAKLLVALQESNAESRELAAQVHATRDALGVLLLLTGRVRSTAALPQGSSDGVAYAASAPAEMVDTRRIERLLGAALVAAGGASPDSDADSAKLTAEARDILETLDVPLGTELSVVQRQYRDRFSDIHPDRGDAPNPRIAAVYQAEREKMQLALALHTRFFDLVSSEVA